MSIFENNPGAMFFLGMVVTLLIGGVVYILIKNGKHRCCDCGRVTKTFFRIWKIEKLPSGLDLYEVYRFHKCQRCERVSEMKYFIKAFDPMKVNQKPEEENLFRDRETRKLFTLTGIPLPSRTHPGLRDIFYKMFPGKKRDA